MDTSSATSRKRSHQPTVHKGPRGWWFQVDVATADGSRRRVKRTGFATATEAKDALKTLMTGKAQPHGRLTVSALVERFLADSAHRSVNTQNQYEWSLTKFKTAFGTRIAADVERDDIGAWVAGLELSPRSRHTIIKHIRAAYKHSIADGLLVFNPASRVQLPSVNPTPKFWTPEQVRAWAIQAEQTLPCTGMATFAIDTAMRRGELCAVRWSQVDLDAGTVKVTEQLRVDSATGQAAVADLKRARRHETMALHPQTIVALATRRQQQNAHRELCGEWPDHDLVWTWPDGSQLDPNWWTRRCTSIARKLGLPIYGPHVFRHSFAAAAIAAGVPLEVVSLRLGHSSIRVTQDLYGHLLPAQDAAIARTIGDMLLPDPGAPTLHQED